MVNINIVTSYYMNFQIACAIIERVGFTVSPQSEVKISTWEGGETEIGYEVLSKERKDGTAIGRIYNGRSGMELNDAVQARLRFRAEAQRDADIREQQWDWSDFRTAAEDEKKLAAEEFAFSVNGPLGQAFMRDLHRGKWKTTQYVHGGRHYIGEENVRKILGRAITDKFIHQIDACMLLKKEERDGNDQNID